VDESDKSKPISVRYFTSPAKPKPKPKAGDRRTTKKHGLQIRVQCMARDWQGKPIGRIVNNGRPMFDWRKPAELDPWDHHHLTREELAALPSHQAKDKQHE
jgi:hypothetical protein